MTEFSLPVKDSDHIDFAHSNYQLIEKIGEGGFAKVYKAKQLNTGQFVAIKFLTLNALQEDEKQRYINRFERETLLSGRLQHPNIVRLLDKGQCSNEHVYAVFEFISGESLKHHLAWSGSFNTVTAADIMAQILDALAHAHGQGVIHRDIKPANIMLTKTGAKIHAKILDFGIGTFVNEQNLDTKNITLTNETLGTPSYSAPEQLRGEPATAKTDIYAWGLVFLECVTGHPAISGSSLASIFHKQLNPANVPLPGAMVDTPLGNFIRRTVSKNTSERAANASDLYQEFTQLNVAAFVGDLSESGNEYSESGGVNTDTNLNQTQLYEPNLLSPPIQKHCAELVENAEWIKLVTLHESPHRKQDREFGDYLRQKYEQNGNTEKLLITLSHLSQAQMFDGDLVLSADGFERAISLFDEQQHQHLASQYGLDVLPYCSALVSLNYLHMGKLNLAIEKVRASMEYGERKQSQASIVIAYTFYALCEYLRGNESKVIELGDIYYQQHDDVDNPMFYRVYLDVLYCSAKGNLAKARELIEPAARSETPFATGWYIHFIAKKHLERQEFNTALELLNLSMSACERVQEYASMPIVQNALAWCLFKQRGVLDHEIQQLLNESLRATKQQQSHFFTLEALTLLQLMQTKPQERLAIQQEINRLTSLFGNQSYRLFIQNDIT